MAIIAKFTRTLPAPTATISGGFVFLLSAGWFTQADTGAAGSPIDGGTNSIANGGGDMQIFSDTAATTRLPIEVVTFVTGGSPQCQVWVRTPSYTAGDTITIGKDDTQTTQPAVGAAFGRNATWIDYVGVWHLDDRISNAVGGASLTTIGTITDSVGKVGGSQNFPSGTNYLNTNTIASISDGSITLWVKPASVSSNHFIFNDRTSTGDYLQIVLIGSSVNFRVVGGSNNITTATGQVSIGVWAKITATWGANGMAVFVDSISKGSNAYTGSWVSNSSFLIGFTSVAPSSQAFDGDIDNILLSTKQATQNYESSEYTNQDDPDNFGTSSEYILVGGSGISIAPPSIVSGESFGLPDVILNTTYLLPTTINSLEAFGEVLVLAGSVTLSPTSITSQESLGTPSVVYSQVILVDGITSEESFGIAIISDGVALVIPVGDRDTYQKIAEYLRVTDKFVSYQNNEILLEWLRSEGVDEGSFNDSFNEYWGQKGYVGAYNDRWKSWRVE